MKQSYFLRAKEVFLGSDIVRKYTFKAINVRDNYALLAKANHQLAMDFAISRERYAHFQRIDCFECLSPHETAA